MCSEENKSFTVRQRHSRMFPFITDTVNPVGLKCPFQCVYCWSQGEKGLVKKYDMKKYQGETQIYYKELGKIRRYGKDAFVFVEDMSDLMAAPKEYILKVLEAISESPATFLLLDKNPLRYLEFELPENVVAGATIETDIDWKVSKAPIPLYRIRAMQNLKHKRKMVSVEPIMKFSPQFIRQLLLIQPEFVAVGYDNYNNHLPEPPLEITEILISGLEAYGIKVYRKTMREANQ